MATKQSFEKTLEALNTVVTTLEKGELPLEEALKHFKHGIKLTQSCQKSLEEAQQKVQMLLEEEDKLTDFYEEDDDDA